MLALRLFLCALFLVIVVYTGVVIARHGIDFLPTFVGDILAMGWPGQFNLDFGGLLLLAGLWVSWRHRFSAGGLALAAVTLVGGTPFLCIYLLVQGARHDGDVRAMLLGARLRDG